MVTGFKSAEPEEGTHRSYLWLGVIMAAVVVTFWAGYPATGLVTPGGEVVHGEHDDD